MSVKARTRISLQNYGVGTQTRVSFYLSGLLQSLDCLQAVALVFDHVLVEMEQSSDSILSEPASPLPSDSGSSRGTPRGSKSPRGHGTTNAALKLLDDLCMMATGDAPVQH